MSILLPHFLPHSDIAATGSQNSPANERLTCEDAEHTFDVLRSLKHRWGNPWGFDSPRPY